MSVENEEHLPADPGEMLRLIHEQQAKTARSLTPDPRLIYWPWGIAWLLGFGLYFLRFGPDGRILVDLPKWLPLTVLFALLAIAGTIQGIAMTKAYGQVSGESARRGQWYGSAWLVGYVSLGVILGRLGQSLPEEQAGLLWAAGAVGLTGVLHIVGGAVFLDRNLYLLGLWVSAINIVGVLLGAGWQALIIALAGGGAMLVAGAVIRIREQRRPA